MRRPRRHRRAHTDAPAAATAAGTADSHRCSRCRHRRAAVAAAPPRASDCAGTVDAPRAPRPTPGASAASAAPPAVTLAELPADLRAQLPALAVGGSVYSPAAASRIVILNGQVFREGDQPVEGLTVEQIGLKSTVLLFQGRALRAQALTSVRYSAR